MHHAMSFWVVLKTEGEALGFQHFLYMVLYLTFLNVPREVLKTMGFAKLPVLSVHPKCVDYVPLHTLKDHPHWDVLNNDKYFQGTNLLQKNER